MAAYAIRTSTGDARGRGLPAAGFGERRVGRFQLEAAIQSAHAQRASTGTTDWEAIQAYELAIGLCEDPATRAFLQSQMPRPSA